MVPLFPIIGSVLLKLSQKRNFQPGAYIFAINGPLYIVFAYIAGPESPSWLMMVNIVIGSSFMFSKPKVGQMLIGIFCLFVGGMFYWMGASLPYSLIISSSLLAFLILFSRTYSYLQLQQSRIESKNKEVEAQKEEIIASINYAKRIQEAILPSNELIKEYLPNSFVLFKPKDIVAGDFYWMDSKDEKTYFSAVDCTGHGVPGAMVSVVGYNGLNRAVKEFNLRHPAEILDSLNLSVEETFEKGRSDIKDGMDLAFCCLDNKARTLEYAGANNPLYYIRNGELEEIKPDSQPVGKHERRKPFTNHVLNLKEGDCIYIFSDGFADQFGGENGKKFKYKQFRELLLSNHGKPMEEQKQLLDESIENWRGELEQVDDICVIGVRV